MSRKIIECVPNFSEGRRVDVIDEIASAIASVPGVALLDRELDADHNRSVFTFAGSPDAVVEAALRGVGVAVKRIDLNNHTGVHPRIGAADVIPFVPIEGMTLAECARLAASTGEEIWKRYELPVYLYEASARRPDRVNLENIRRGQFEGLRQDVVTDPERRPDIGGPGLHLTAGAAVVGARKFLIAYNINLNTPDVAVAKRIARKIRFSSGGMPFVKAMGVPLASRNLAQVSMNLTDFEQTPVHKVFEAVRAEAERDGVEIAGSEIIGLIPRKAVEMTADFYLRFENFRPDAVLENRLASALEGRGLDEFLNELAASTPTPGGGSASAAAAAMAASLGAMVAGIAGLSRQDFDADRFFLADAVRRDAAAYDGVVAAYKRPKEERAPYVEAAFHTATAVPLEVAERSHQLKKRLETLSREAPKKVASDVEVALHLASAALSGALANVRINVPFIKDEDFRRSVDSRRAALETE